MGAFTLRLLNPGDESFRDFSATANCCRLTFDMRGAQKAQPFVHPLDGRVGVGVEGSTVLTLDVLDDIELNLREGWSAQLAPRTHGFPTLQCRGLELRLKALALPFVFQDRNLSMTLRHRSALI